MTGTPVPFAAQSPAESPLVSVLSFHAFVLSTVLSTWLLFPEDLSTFSTANTVTKSKEFWSSGFKF